MNKPSNPGRTHMVSCDWLDAHLNDDDIRVVEASWHMPASGRNAREEFEQMHIPGAVFFDIDAVSAESPLPHTMPDDAQFAQATASLGIRADHHVVVYDSIGLFSAARVWWMFRHFGAQRVSVLDGGLPAWTRYGGKVVSSDNEAKASSVSTADCEASPFRATVDSQASAVLVDAETVLRSLDKPDTVILDARSPGRFSGAEKEPRAGLRSGHIPNSHNLPFQSVLNDQGMLKTADELRAVFAPLPLTPQSTVITSCGSGVTAAVLCLALEEAGYGSAGLYDGSWSEWGGRGDLPVATDS